MIVNPRAAVRYFIDTEYEWRPCDSHMGDIRLISIALVTEDGRELYLVHSDADCVGWSQFVSDHVIPALNTNERYFGYQIRDQIRDFIGDDIPDFWGDYCAFDYVVLSMIMGRFEDWPDYWPMHMNDLQQEAIPPLASEIPHNALADARAIRDSFVHARAMV